MASAQVKSCLLLAGLYAEGKTTVTEPAPTRDHTERMLRGFGYTVESNGPVASLQSGGKLTATRIEVPADISSAAFFLVAASIAEGSELVLEHVGIERAFGQRVVRLHVVVEFDDPDLVALFFQDRLDAQLQLVGIRAGAGADDEFFRVLGMGGGGEGQAGGGQEQITAKVVHAGPCF